MAARKKKTPTKKISSKEKVDEKDEETKQEIKEEQDNIEETPQKEEVEEIETQEPQDIKESTESTGTVVLSDTGDKNGSIMKSAFSLFVIFIIGLMLGGGIIFSYQWFNQTPVEEEKQEAPTPTEELASTPQPSLTEEEISKYSIEVLNGSGVSGAAAKVKSILEEKGFAVKSVGNADASDFEETVIQAGKDVPSLLLDQLKKVLSANYTVGSSKKLDEDAATDIVVIVGNKPATESSE